MTVEVMNTSEKDPFLTERLRLMLRGTSTLYAYDFHDPFSPPAS
jgi:hypothetical protein